MKKFSEIVYTRPDLETLKKKYSDYVAKLENAENAQEAIDAVLDCDRLLNELITLQSVASVRNTMDTKDEFYDKEIEFFNNELPKMIPYQKKYRGVILNSRFRKELEQEFGVQYFKILEADEKTQDESIMENLVQESLLGTEYQKLAASCNVEFNGETCNFYGLLKYMQNPDRNIRKEAYLAWAKLYEGISEQLDSLYDKLVAQRNEMAKKLGFEKYTELGYLLNHRLDYTPKEVASFREQVKEHIVPFCQKIRETQAKRIGVDSIKYYDEMFVFPSGNPNPVGNKDQMVQWAKEMYHEMSKETGEFFDFMVEYDLFDLETRPGKHLGGYCTAFPTYKAPFIFSNFNGTSADVDVLTHEAGHAFEYFVASRRIPLSDLCFSTSEINEIHSMSMEFFAYHWMDKFFGENKDKYKYFHMSDTIMMIPYIVLVDEFQHKVYDNPGMTADERYTVWRELEKVYLPWRDYDGVEFLEKGGFWMQKQHIFLYPFYYIDYALAQLNSCELYGRRVKDSEKAWKDYLALCERGGSKGYYELLESANLSNFLLGGSVKDATAKVFEDIEELGRRL